MPELGPLLDREFDDFDLMTHKDPEDDEINAPEVPMVYVELNPTKKEKAARKAELNAKNVEKQGKHERK